MSGDDYANPIATSSRPRRGRKRMKLTHSTVIVMMVMMRIGGQFGGGNRKKYYSRLF